MCYFNCIALLVKINHPLNTDKVQVSSYGGLAEYLTCIQQFLNYHIV